MAYFSGWDNWRVKTRVWPARLIANIFHRDTQRKPTTFIQFLVRPKTIVFGRTSVLLQMFYFFFRREISEMRGPTGVKFCTMVSIRPYFIMPSKILGGTPQKNFGGEKYAKFGPISDDLEVRRRISLKRIKIFKIGFLFRLPQFLLR